MNMNTDVFLDVAPRSLENTAGVSELADSNTALMMEAANTNES
jgi:hypothetical protein